MTGFMPEAPRQGAYTLGRALLSAMRLFKTPWAERRLIMRLVRRDLESRYRGSLFGGLWTVLSPLIMLALYTFVFEGVFRARWPGVDAHPVNFATLLFLGLTLFWLISEPIGRAPRLLIEQKEFVKKVRFHVEILPWVTSLGALLTTGLNLGLTLAGFVVLNGWPPISAVSIPVILIPLFLFGLGVNYVLAALGVFIRDLQPIISVALTGLMFLSPIFFPLSGVADAYRWILELNPLAPLLEAARNALSIGEWPDVAMLGSMSLLGWIVAVLGYALFLRVRHGFADVL
jgi:lipopolysaccharide transport system permease protein